MPVASEVVGLDLGFRFEEAWNGWTELPLMLSVLKRSELVVAPYTPDLPFSYFILDALHTILK